MSEARKHLYHLWQLAEELAVHAGQPLHAFLLLHHSLTQPPLALRHATTGVRGGPSPSSADAATPLHSIAWDAEWKAEELATRVRAAEYLLFPDVLVAAPSPAATATAAPRTLSRRAALESLELAEQVLAPVFAASSHSSGAPSAQASTAHRSGKADSLFSGEFDVEMAARGSGRDDRSGGSSHHGGSSAVGNARVSSMYFLNDNTVAALAWPLAAFTLTWPLTDQKPCGSASQPVFHFHAANQTIMVPVALVVRAHVLQSMVCYRRVQYRRALQCLHAARAWVTRQLVEAAAQERSLRLLWTDLVERQSRPPQLPPQPLPHFRPLMQRILVGERRACEALLSLEECRVHTMIVQSCGTLPPPPLLRTQDGVGSSGMAEDGGVAEPTLTHAPDLRLHYKQYQESVHQLHQQSRMYMEVLEWMAEEQEEENEDDSKGNNNGGVEARSVRVKVEGEAQKGSVADAGLPITALHSVRSQLSPFCLCALRRTTLSSSPSPAQSAQTAPFAARYNVRLAAEVLGWYHCLSHLYVLYQPPLPSTLTGANHGAARGTADSSAMEKEAAFLTRMTYKSKTASPPAPVASTAAPLHDAVQRALLHFRAYAAVFGSDSHDAEGGVVSPSPLPHEAALLLCLAEVAVADSYPFALHFCADTTNARGSAAGGSVGTAKVEASVAVTDVKLEEEESGESALGHRKRVRSTAAETAMHSQQAATTTRNSALPAVSAPPLSGHWVLPGVRAVLKLYIELTTVLMQAASTMHQSSVSASNSGSTPPPSPPLTAARLPNSALSAAAAAAAAPSPYAPTPPPGAPAVPILQVGLPRAEQLLARLLFTIDREMLQLTGNAWSVGVVPAAAAAAAEAASRPSQMARGLSRAGASHPGPPSPTPTVESAEVSAAAAAWTDRLLSSSPAQLRWLVQIKSAALLTMARHHLTQLSLVRCAFYLREVQQFTRVFHRQARLSLAPETHVLLAAAATSMALRRLPAKEKKQRRSQGSSGTGGGGALAVSDDDINAGSVVTDDEEEDLADDDDDGAWASGSAVYALAQGWPSPDTTGAGSAFALTPEEEATVAQDVGLPYAHLLAAERAARTSLHTPPAFSLLVYLMKAWAVYQLVAAGEELTWAAPPPLHQHHHHHHRHDHTVPQPQPQPRHGNPVTVSPLSPVCAPLPLPAASFATTTLNSTLADQQRRVARLDSLTSTPTTTPTLRSRHAAMPPEMQRIQLDGPGVLSPAISPVSVETAEVSVAAEGAARRDAPPHKEGAVKEAPRTAAATAVGAAFQSQRAATRDRLAASSSSTLTATAAPLPPTAHVTAISLTVRHRAGEVLQRMMAVLRHHYEAHVAANAAAASASLSSSPSGAASSVPAAAWTPQNITLFRLLRGAVLLSEDHDELAAALELKEATHYAKARLGVLHPFVADGLTLLTAAYASLDGEGSTAGGSHSSERAQGVAGDAAVQPDSAARTRRVAVQLAMRSSCAALASLSAAAAPSLPSQAVPGAVAGRATAEDTTRAAEAVASPDVLHARLQAWWSRQVLSEMCSNGSPHRSEHARRQLQALFDWLPGAPEYVF